MAFTAPHPDVKRLDRDTLGGKLLRRRTELGLTQVEAAERMGVNEFSVSNWEADANEPLERMYPAIIAFLGYEPLPEPVTFADQLIAERKRRGLSRKAAAELLRFDEGSLCWWEVGGRKPKSLRVRAALKEFLSQETGTPRTHN